MRIPIVRPAMPELAEIQEDLAECLRSGLVTNNGPHVQRFEEALWAHWGCRIRPSVNCNGEMALFHLLQAWKERLGAGPHDSFEVLLPSFTFAGTVNAVVANNLKPVFCDVDDTLVLDLRKLEADSRDVRMVLPVGAYGNLCDLDALAQFAHRHELAVVLDNAPAFGSRFHGRHPHEWGFSEIYSFHATKIFNSMEGGATLVHDDALDAMLRRLKDFGQFEKTRGDVDMPGLNSKMTEVCALVVLRNLARVDETLASRSRVIARYVEFFGGLERRGLLRTMRVAPEVSCTYLYFPVVLDEEASAFADHMQANGVGVRRYYTATHALKLYQGRYRRQDLSHTEAIRDRVVSLPLHSTMTEAEMDHLFGAVASYFSGRNA